MQHKFFQVKYTNFYTIIHRHLCGIVQLGVLCISKTSRSTVKVTSIQQVMNEEIVPIKVTSVELQPNARLRKASNYSYHLSIPVGISLFTCTVL